MTVYRWTCDVFGMTEVRIHLLRNAFRVLTGSVVERTLNPNQLSGTVDSPELLRGMDVHITESYTLEDLIGALDEAIEADEEPTLDEMQELLGMTQALSRSASAYLQSQR